MVPAALKHDHYVFHLLAAMRVSQRNRDRLRVISQTRVLKWSDRDSGGFGVLKLSQAIGSQSNLLQGHLCAVGFEVEEISK
ncbi:hypothetical protein VAEU17_4400107 [Vibrio aestuarianus]|nr:hypothetical protein VAEU17_4400107 [Vibrio aestuarianus]